MPTTTTTSRTITVSINRTPADVYRYASNPANLPQWGTAFCKSIRQVNGEWIITTANEPPGEVKFRFVDANNFGVLDHDVTVAPGVTIHMPMRVVPNNDGSEVMLTLTRLPKMTDAEFERDAEWITRDLQSLKRVLESRS